MSSWAQQREAIRRAAQGGVRARTNAQGSQRLPLANNRLREVLLSRPNGELTRAGQFYYGLVGGRPPSRQFDEEQPLIREGPTDYILIFLCVSNGCDSYSYINKIWSIDTNLKNFTPIYFI